MNEQRQKALDYIDLHLMMLHQAKKNGQLATLDFKQSRLIGIVGMAKELDLITVEEYLEYINKIEI